jgi:hypothetical protein
VWPKHYLNFWAKGYLNLTPHLSNLKALATYTQTKKNPKGFSLGEFQTKTSFTDQRKISQEWPLVTTPPASSILAHSRQSYQQKGSVQVAYSLFSGYFVSNRRAEPPSQSLGIFWQLWREVRHNKALSVINKNRFTQLTKFERFTK